jgi:hypothetical protein
VKKEIIMRKNTIFILAFLFVFSSASNFADVAKKYRPDLVIEKIYREPPYPNLAENKPTSFKIYVKNKGVTSCKTTSKLFVRAGGNAKAIILKIPALRYDSAVVLKLDAHISKTQKSLIYAYADYYGQIAEYSEKNNAKKFVNNPGKPDFVVEDIRFSNNKPKAGEEVTIRVKVKNRGDAHVSPFMLRIRIGGETKAMHYRVKSYGIDASIPPITRKFTSKYKREYLITAEVDPRNKWREKKENNNTKRVKLRFY